MAKPAPRRTLAHYGAPAVFLLGVTILVILIHSALRSPSEILAFKKEWGDRCPVVIVPPKDTKAGKKRN